MSPADYKRLLRMARILESMSHTEHEVGKYDMNCPACRWHRLRLEVNRTMFIERQHPDYSWEVTKAIRDR